MAYEVLKLVATKIMVQLGKEDAALGDAWSFVVHWRYYLASQTDKDNESLVALTLDAITKMDDKYLGRWLEQRLDNLKRITFPENYDSLRGGVVEMRYYVRRWGILLYKLGKVGRWNVNVKGNDGISWEILRKSGPLVKFAGNYNTIATASMKKSIIERERNADDSELGEQGDDADVVTINSQARRAYMSIRIVM